MGCAFATLILVAAIGASALVSLLLRTPRVGMSVGIAVGVVVTIVAGFALTIRRAAMFFREQDQLFERFQKGRESHGSGLGLSIARRRARAHGGDVVVESGEGIGTTFTMSLPR
jgi:signal transduction histidine kinase